MDAPPPRVLELFREGARLVLDPPPEWLQQLDDATLAGSGTRAVIADDPALAEATRRTNRSNLLFWATANVRAPGEPVPPNTTETPLAIARDLVRRGLDAEALDGYRVGQAVAMRLWTQVACSLTDDRGELAELLDLSLRSIGDFLDATIAFISARMEEERADLRGGDQGGRLEVVRLLLEGAPIRRAQAEQRLRYELDPTHTAAVVWVDDPAAHAGELERTVAAIAAAASTPRPLAVTATAASRWVWVHGSVGADDLEPAARAVPSVRVALGSPRPGVEGFRRSHLDALMGQRLLARLGSPRRVVAHRDVELVALLSSSPADADRFVQRALGRLEHAAPDVQDAVRAWIAEGCSASRAAERSFVHRNTLLRRLARAEELLPVPLASALVDVGAALELLRWRGPS